MESAFSGLSLIIVVGAAIALAMRLLGQPLIIGHIITGILVGPAVLHVAKSPDTLTIFSDIGIALLLFIIGLGLNPRAVREVGRTAAIVGLVQVGAITLLGWLIISGLGFNRTEAAFLGAAIAFSSTIIILKLLSDKREQDRLYGKIAISVSLVQDIVAIFLVVVTSAGSGKHLAIGSIIWLLIKALFLAWVIYGISFRVLPRFNHLISESQEYLFLFAIAWGLGSAALFAKIGLRYEIGALLAGICLASLPYAQEIAARLRPLRDFFVIVFFISIGAGLSFSDSHNLLPVVLVGLLLGVVVKPLAALSVLGFLGYTKRTSFKTAIALAQVSEFSIVLVVLGASRGLIGHNVVAALTLIALISIAASTYMITFSDKFYGRFEKYLDLFERRKTHDEPPRVGSYELILFGYQKGGHEFVNVFKRLKKKFVVVDYDPEIIELLEHRGIEHLYGDATDVELLEEAGAAKAKLIVSTITDFQTTTVLLAYVKAKNPNGVFIGEAESPAQAAKLYHQGASYVILPHFIGGEQIGGFIGKSALSKSAFKKFRQKHLKYLEDEFGELDKLVEHDQKLGRAIVKGLTSLTGKN